MYQELQDPVAPIAADARPVLAAARAFRAASDSSSHDEQKITACKAALFRAIAQEDSRVSQKGTPALRLG